MFLQRLLSKETQWVLPFLRPYGVRLGLYFFLEVFSLIMGLTFIWYTKRAIDLAVGSEIVLMKRSLVMVGTCAAAGLFANLYARWLNERTLALMLIAIQSRIFLPNLQASWTSFK